MTTIFVWPTASTQFFLSPVPKASKAAFADTLLLDPQPQATLAQLVEHSIRNRKVVGSNPTGGSIKINGLQTKTQPLH